MSPHRLTTIRRYKISNDVLILILENLDPDTLYRTCKVFRRVYVLTMEFLPLRYKYELALAGMKTGAITNHGPPFTARFSLLLAYRTDWPTLNWTHEQKARISLLGQFDVSCGFMHYVDAHGVELMELPSCRTGRAPSQTRHVRIPTAPRVECVALDLSQNLIITSHASVAPNQIDIFLKIRDMWTFNKHKGSVSDHYSFAASATPGMVLSSINVTICGDKLLVRLDFGGPTPRTEQLLINWKTLHAVRLAKQDIHFLDANRILVVEEINGVTSLFVYNIRNVQQPARERQLQLPDAWKGCMVNFHKYDGPVDGFAASSTLFYSDPSHRIIILSARPSLQARPTNWMILHEWFFSCPLARGPCFAWNDWCQYVIVRNTVNTRLVGKPAVVGSRVLYLDQDSTGTRMRLNSITFSPYADIASTSPQMWDFVGKCTGLVPIENRREIPAANGQGFKLQDLRVTEDNIILLYENRGGQMPLKILTFGAPNVSSSPR